ncbi:MAG TPA: MFS transporter [Pseudonocardia sp.]|uniref:MFS transporter n=1 Tax=Pseudonocardia sp. TaxID=60912 RepID=UPI002B4B2E2A|nr:MFS transporter [Pseudonocardia sp.]HLU55174.1 MFS transporter [Pseudonocardia sp.]
MSRGDVITGHHRVVAASGLANLGDGVRQVALPLSAAAITHDAVLVAGLTAVAYVPWMLFGLPVGALVDRARPELYVVWAAVLRGALFGALALALVLDVRSMVLLYAVAFPLGVGEAAYDNASQSLIPRVVADAVLERANSALVGVERLGQDLIGPAVGGVMFAAAASLPFAVSAAALLLAGVLVTGLRTPAPAVAGRPTPGAVLREAAEGIRWLTGHRFVRTIVVTGAGLTFFTQTWEGLLVLLAVGPMGTSEAVFGLVLAGGAVGGIVGALATAPLVRRFPQRALQVAALAVAAAGDLVLAAVPTPLCAAVVLSTTSFSFALWNVLSVTIRQRLVPPAVLGRVNAASRTLSMTAAPLGALAGGGLAAALGLRAPLWISGVALVAITGLFVRATRPQLTATGRCGVTRTGNPDA